MNKDNEREIEKYEEIARRDWKRRIYEECDREDREECDREDREECDREDREECNKEDTCKLLKSVH